MSTAFSNEWAVAWGDALNASPTYRAAAATWEGSIATAVVPAPGAPPLAAAFLDVWHGECRTARSASAADLATADYLIEGSPDAWRELLGGRLAPLMALLTGRIQLTRGELSKLIPFAGAAKELVGLAASIDATFPPEWGD